MVKTGVNPACVTVTVFEPAPTGENVTVAFLGLMVGFALEAVTVTEPVPEPDEGLTDNQVASSETDQLAFELKLIFPVDPVAEPIDKDVEETLKYTPLPVNDELSLLVLVPVTFKLAL
jgi:hypothetical protein